MTEQLPVINTSHNVTATKGEPSSLLGRGLAAIQNKKLTPEDEQKLLPALTRLMDAGIRLGYANFKENAIFVMNKIRDKFGNKAASLIKLKHLKGAYLFANNGTSSEEEVISFKSLEDLLAEPKQTEAEQLDVLDSEIMRIGIESTVFYLEGGIRSFVDVANKLPKDIGASLDTLKPYLRAWYNSARDMMEDSGFDVSDMDNRETVAKEFAKLFSEKNND